MREGELTYDDFLRRLNIQDVLIAQCLIRFPIWELIQTGLMPLLNWG